MTGAPGVHVFNLRLEPAGHTDGTPLQLQLIDSKDQVVSEYSVGGMENISLEMLNAPGQERYRLHVVNGVQPSTSDPRTLNFRVFELSEVS
jgi:hypothetical protein